MIEPPATSFFDLTSVRRGHFQLESGHHSELWFDLDALFAVPQLIDPLVRQLANLVRSYEVTAVCGPLLGGAFVGQLIAHALDIEFCFTERVIPGDTGGLYRASYRLPAASAKRVHGARIAIVDDVMSAGSALRGTYVALKSHGANPVVAGALMVLGNAGAGFFTEQGIAVAAVFREDYSLWLPAECPHCAAGIPLEHVATESIERISEE
jgi:orotate phosphoribosyltransferase